MAVTFQLTDTLTTLTLSNATDFIVLDGYIPTIATPTGDGSIPPLVTEIIPVIVVSTSDDILAASLQTFHILQAKAAAYRVDPTVTLPVWLQCKTADETGTRRALVYSLSIEFNNKLGGLYDALPLLEGGRAATIIIERHPYWESSTSRAFPESTNLGTNIMGRYDYTAAGNGGTPAARDLTGDVGARIGTLSIHHYGVGKQVERIWAGIRSANKHGALINWMFEWECENGTNNAAESGVTDEAHAGASNGAFVEVTEVDLDWDSATNGDIFQTVYDTELSDTTANEADNYGDFLWLLRALVDSGTWQVRLLHGYTGQSSTEWVIGPTVEITSTSWDLHEMGSHAIPLRNLRAVTDTASGATDTYESANAIRLQAKRTSGAGDLNVDCLSPVPLDEGWIKISGFRAKDGVTADEVLWIGESPEGDWWGGSTSDAATVVWDRIATIEDHNFRLPPGDGRIYFVFARESTSERADALSFSLLDTGAFWERWSSLRGAE